MLFALTKGADPLSEVDVVGAAEASEILRVELQRISRWRKAGKLPPVYAQLAATPTWKQEDIERFARGERDGFTEPPSIPTILGTAEVARLLEVDKKQIGRWRSRPPRHGPAFPPPGRELKATPVWERASIEHFAVQWHNGRQRTAEAGRDDAQEK